MKRFILTIAAGIMATSAFASDMRLVGTTKVFGRKIFVVEFGNGKMVNVVRDRVNHNMYVGKGHMGIILHNSTIPLIKQAAEYVSGCPVKSAEMANDGRDLTSMIVWVEDCK